MLGRRLGAAATCGEWVCVLSCSLHLAKKKKEKKKETFISQKQTRVLKDSEEENLDFHTFSTRQ